jgi:hypothetical protein
MGQKEREGGVGWIVSVGETVIWKGSAHAIIVRCRGVILCKWAPLSALGAGVEAVDE